MPKGLADLTDPSAVQSALDEFLWAGQQTFLDRHGYGKASGYVVRDPRSGLWADSKAIAGVAVGYQHPDRGALRAVEFSGGVDTVVRRLTELGL